MSTENNTSREYSFIYKELVQDKNDLVGHIAYSIYKSQKILFIKRYKEEHSGEEPPNSNFLDFHQFSKSHLQGYRLEAQTILLDWSNQSLADYTSDIDNEASEFKQKTIEEYTEKLKTALEKLKPGLARGAAQSMLGSIGFTVLLFILFVFGLYFGVDSFFDGIRAKFSG